MTIIAQEKNAALSEAFENLNHVGIATVVSSWSEQMDTLLSDKEKEQAAR